MILSTTRWRRPQLPGRATTAALALFALAMQPASAVVIEFTPPVAVGDINEFEISPDGTQVAFVGSLDNGFGNDDQSYVAPIGGGAATMVNPSTTGDNDGGVAWLPDGSAVATRWEVTPGSPADNEYYLVPANGAQTPTRMTFGSTNAFDVQISSDGSALFYSDVDALYVTSVADPMNTTRVRLTPDGLSEIDTGSYAQVGTDVLFSGFSTPTPGAGNSTPEDTFYRRPADGSGSLTQIVVTNFPTDGSADIDFVGVTPDEQTIIFRGDLTVDGQDELYSLPITGGAAMPLITTPLAADADVGSFAISPDGTTIAFQGDLTTNGVGELYVIPATGGVPIVVNDPLGTPGSDVASGVDKIAFSNDSRSIYYLADGRTDGTFELFRVSNPIPEPTAIFLVLTGLTALSGIRRRTVA